MGAYCGPGKTDQQTNQGIVSTVGSVAMPTCKELIEQMLWRWVTLQPNRNVKRQLSEPGSTDLYQQRRSRIHAAAQIIQTPGDKISAWKILVW